MSDLLLEMKSITKTFSKVVALNQVTLNVKEAEIHAVVGENGAGKSTLMKVLSGVYPCGTYKGDIVYKNKVCQFKDIKDSEKKGIVIIHQELALIPYLSIAENIFLGNEQAEHGVINWNQTHQKTIQLLEKVGLSENPHTLVGDIGIGKQQLVEIAKALSKEVELLVLDEPTRGIDVGAKYEIYQMINELAEQGKCVIVISSELPEVIGLSDRIYVMNEGQSVGEVAKVEVTGERIMSYIMENGGNQR